MLGKLTKNTFKAHASAISRIYVAMGIIGVVMLVLMLVDWTKWGDTGIGLGLAIKCLASGALCITALIGIIMTYVAVFSEFSRSMYSKEGHLTMTLPVKSSSLLLSKWLSGSFWVILSYTTFCLCAGGSALYIIKHSLNLVQDDELYSTVFDLIKEMLEQIFAAAGIVAPSMGVLLNLVSVYAFDGAVRACVFVLIVYFAISLSHSRPFNKAGKFGTILYFFGGTFIINTFASIITKLVKIYFIISDEYYTFTLSEKQVQKAWSCGCGAYSITNLYATVIISVALFLLVAYVIDRKVNVD